MIKSCEVLSYNPYSNILAFKYDDLIIQISINKKLDKAIRYVNIKFENNDYFLTDEDVTKDVKSSKKIIAKEIELEVKEEQVSAQDVENVL